jgi:hypothetical protein
LQHVSTSKNYETTRKQGQNITMAGVRDQYGLTPKQRKFAENLADGMSQADAYRNAYDASDMQSDTIRSKASLMAQRDDVRTAVDTLVGERMRLLETRGVSDRKQVAELAKKFAQDEKRNDAIRLRALELWGRTCGAFVEVIEDRRERPTFAVANELERRLTLLLSASAPHVTVIDMQSERVNGADDGDDSLPLVAGSDPAGSGDDDGGLNDAEGDAISDTQTPL